jgi:uncharacterized membrane protein
MPYRYSLLASAVLIVAMVAISLWGMHAIPAAARIAIHWNVEGAVDGYAGKPKALWLMPAMALGLTALFAALPALEPRQKNLLASNKLFHATWIGTLLLLAVLHGRIVIGAAAGITSGPLGISLVAVAFLTMLIGNFLGKTKSNFFLGVRTPWTLSSDYAWEKSNRLAGRLLFAAGLLTLPVYSALGHATGFRFYIAAVLSSALVAIVASYVFWRRDPERGRTGTHGSGR